MEYEKFKKDAWCDFMQMPRFVWESSDLSINAKCVYMLILDRLRISSCKAAFTDLDGAVFCYYSDDELAEKLGLSRPSAKRAVLELKRKGLLSRERTKTRDGKAVTYLSIPVGWIADEPTKDSLAHERANQRLIDEPTKGSPVSQPFLISDNNVSENNDSDIGSSACIKDEPTKKPDPKASRAKAATQKIIIHWNSQYGTKYGSGSKQTIKLVSALLEADYEPDQIIQVIDYRARSRKSQEDYRWFTPSTVLALKNFQRSYEWMINEEATRPDRSAYLGHEY